MAKRELTFVIRAKNLFTRTLRSAKAQLGSFIRGAGRAAAGAVVGFVALAGAVAMVGRRLLNLYAIQARAESKLASVLKATGYAAGFTAGQLIKQAAELQKLTGIGDEVIISMQGILASFREIKGDTFTKATEAVLDMSAVMGKAGQASGDIEAAVIQVGKALNDPIKGMTALSRMGVTFTAQQKEQIKVMQEAGNIAGAQAVILRELEGEFGGAAKGVNSTVKAMALFKATLSDIGEQFGKAIAETSSFDGVLTRLQDTLNALQESGKIELWAENMVAAFDRVAKAAGPVATGISKVSEALVVGSGFIGALLGGADIAGAAQIAVDTQEDMRKETDERLKAIRERVAKERAETAKGEQSAMQAAKIAAKERRQDEIADELAATPERAPAPLVGISTAGKTDAEVSAEIRKALADATNLQTEAQEKLNDALLQESRELEALSQLEVWAENDKGRAGFYKAAIDAQQQIVQKYKQQQAESRKQLDIAKKIGAEAGKIGEEYDAAIASLAEAREVTLRIRVIDDEIQALKDDITAIMGGNETDWRGITENITTSRSEQNRIRRQNMQDARREASFRSRKDAGRFITQRGERFLELRESARRLEANREKIADLEQKRSEIGVEQLSELVKIREKLERNLQAAGE